MKKYKQLWVSEATHKRAKQIAASKGCSIDKAIAEALGKNAQETENKVKSYGLFK